MDPLGKAALAIFALDSPEERSWALDPLPPRARPAQPSANGGADESALLARLQAAAAAARCPRVLGCVADELLAQLDQRGRGCLTVQQVACRAGHARENLGLAPRGALPTGAGGNGGGGNGSDGTEEDLFLAATVHDRGGRNVLDRGGLVGFLRAFLTECAGSVARACPQEPGSPPATPRSLPRAPPSSPAVEVLRLNLRTLAGETHQVQLPSGASTEELHVLLARSPFAGRSKLEAGAGAGGPGSGGQRQHLFTAGGRLLQEGKALEVQGVGTGDFVDMVRITPPPARVRLHCEGFGCGPSIRGSCGTFRRAPASRTKNGRPVYVRDRRLSQWNPAMAYHGTGSRYLLYEEHPEAGGRWALVDGEDWGDYADSSYAFAAGDEPHPGYLEGRRWCVYRDAKYRPKREWLEHESLRLSVEEEDEEEEEDGRAV